jgi:integrase
MSVRKRTWTTRNGEKKEAWIVDCADKDGVRHIETFQTKGEADDHAAKVRMAVKKGMHTAPSKSITVAEAADKWIKSAEAHGLEWSTLAGYRQHSALHIVPRLGKAKLASLTDAKIEDFRDDLLANLSRPLARKVMVSLRSLLKANKYDHIGQGLTIRREKRHKQKLEIGRDIPVPAEVKRLVDAAKDAKTRVLLLLAALTGLRASELRGLRWSDIDLKHLELHVRQRADKYYEIGAPKSETSQRTIPIDQGVLLPALREWRLAGPKVEADLVFPDAEGRPTHHEILFRLLTGLQQDAGVVDKSGEAKYGLHAFRHFFASWCINSRAKGGRELPPKEAQELLGHSSITMTLDLYGHLFPKRDDPAELAQSVSALLG